MSTGQLDGFRASVIAFELDIAPAHVADAVVAALSEHLGDDAPTLRRRTRVLLSHISPDLVRERATRARASTGLRRWVAEPGVDEWHGTFPSEDAATAWAAIDRLAHDLVLGGTCTTLEQARGKALTDLVTGNAHPLAVTRARPPVGRAAGGGPRCGRHRRTGRRPRRRERPRARAREPAAGRDPSDEDLVQVQGARPSEPLLVRRGWLGHHLATTTPPMPAAARRA